jgi:hypothetical protein
MKKKLLRVFPVSVRVTCSMVEKHKEKKRSQNYDQRERNRERKSTRERLIEGFFDSILKLLKTKRQKL